MTTRTLLTVNDFVNLPELEDGTRYELSHGELIVLPMSRPIHNRVKTRFCWLIQSFLEEHELGEVVVEGEFKIGDGVRRPDVAFVSNRKIAAVTDEDPIYLGIPVFEWT